MKEFLAAHTEQNRWDQEVILHTFQGECYIGKIIRDLPSPETKWSAWVYIGDDNQTVIGVPFTAVKNIKLMG